MVRLFAITTIAVLTTLLSSTQIEAQRTPGAWTTLEKCTLMPYGGNDGDSFKIKFGKEEAIFRLYFVDTPESSDTYPERIADQARYFKLQDSQVTSFGETASQFTKRYLIGKFTVHTKWEDARGNSEPRYYAIVDNGTIPLSQALVINGLARIYGMPAKDAWPGGLSPRRFLDRLKQAERDAQRQRTGQWDLATNSPQSIALNKLNAPASDSTSTYVAPAGSTSASNGGPININTASSSELETLSGIGPSLAGKIIANRPYEIIEELQNIPGIGVKTFARFRSKIITAPPPPTPLTAEFYLADPKTYLNTKVVVKVASVGVIDQNAPETFRALKIQTANAGKSGGSFNAFIPEEFFDAFMRHYSTPGKEFTGLFYEQKGEYVLVYQRGQTAN